MMLISAVFSDSLTEPLPIVMNANVVPIFFTFEGLMDHSYTYIFTLKH